MATGQGATTRQRILEAAGEVFAEVGFRQATVREICGRAGANIAAVNYHFRDKDNLYIETLRYWKDIAFLKYPGELGTSQNDPPEERLRGFIRSFVFRILDSGKESRFGRLMAKEYSEPTSSLDIIVDEVARPMFILLSSIIASIINRNPSEQIVRYCCASIVSQCLYFLYAKPILRKLIGDEEVFNMDMEPVAEHIFRFSMAALAAMRENTGGDQ